MPLNIEGYEIRDRDVRMYEQTNIVRAGLVLHLDASIFNTVTYGTTWFDLSGNGNNGTLTNGPTYNSGNGGSIVFDGVDDTVNLLHTSTPITNLTYEIFTKIDYIPPSNTLRSIWQKSANWNGSTGISLQMIYGSLRFSYGETWAGSASYLLTNLTQNNWYHIVGTSTATSSGTTRLYVNGLLVGSGTGGTPTTTSMLQVGLGNGGTLLGNISMFRSYNRALTATEIAHNYNVTKGRFGL